jgi:hypothetical protein
MDKSEILSRLDDVVTVKRCLLLIRQLEGDVARIREERPTFPTHGTPEAEERWRMWWDGQRQRCNELVCEHATIAGKISEAVGRLVRVAERQECGYLDLAPLSRHARTLYGFTWLSPVAWMLESPGEAELDRLSARLLNWASEFSREQRSEGMPAKEANLKVREYLASKGAGAVNCTVREIAEAIGCSKTLVGDTAAWKAVQGQKKLGRRPKTVRLTDALEDTLGVLADEAGTGAAKIYRRPSRRPRNCPQRDLADK